MARISSLAEAIKSAVRDGDTIALEGFTHLIPHAAGHEIVRQGRKGLTLIRMTPDLVYDQLIGMGCVSKLVFSWGGNPGVGSLHRLRDAIENGWPQKLELEEHSHAAMANAYEAGAAGLPCAIFRGYIGGDLPKVNSKIKRVTCPFTGEELAAVYVPTTPNPTSGYLEVVPMAKLIFTDWSMDQAMTFIISGGAVSPERIPFTRGTTA